MSKAPLTRQVAMSFRSSTNSLLQDGDRGGWVAFLMLPKQPRHDAHGQGEIGPNPNATPLRRSF